MTAIALNPLNDLTLLVTLKTVTLSTGAITPVTSGTVAGFLAISNTPTATVADATLNATCTYTGANGKWTIAWDGAVLTAALMNSLFAAVAPYAIVTLNTSDIRVYVPLTYTASRAATVP